MDFSSMVQQAKKGAESGDEADVVKDSEPVVSPEAEVTSAPIEEKATHSPSKTPTSDSKALNQADGTNTQEKDLGSSNSHTASSADVDITLVRHIIKTVDVYRNIFDMRKGNREHIAMLAKTLGLEDIADIQDEAKVIKTVLGSDKELFVLFDTLKQVKALEAESKIFALLECDDGLLVNIHSLLTALFPHHKQSISGANKVETVKTIYPLINEIGEDEEILFQDIVNLLEVVHRV